METEQPAGDLIPAAPATEPVTPARPAGRSTRTGTAMSHYVTLVIRFLAVMVVLRAAATLLSANPDQQIIAVLYRFTDPFVAPFDGIFPSSELAIDWAALVTAGALLLVGAFIGAAGRRAAELQA